MSKEGIWKHGHLCFGKDYITVVMELCSPLPLDVEELATFCSCKVVSCNVSNPCSDRHLVVMEIINPEKFEDVINKSTLLLHLLGVKIILPVDNARLSSLHGTGEELIQLGLKYLQEVDFITSTVCDTHLSKKMVGKGSLQMQALTPVSDTESHACVSEDLMFRLLQSKAERQLYKTEACVLKNMLELELESKCKKQKEMETLLAARDKTIEELKKEADKCTCQKVQTGKPEQPDQVGCKIFTGDENFNGKSFPQPQKQNSWTPKPFDCTGQAGEKFPETMVFEEPMTDYKSLVEVKSMNAIKGHCEATKVASLNEKNSIDKPVAQQNSFGHQYSVRNKESGCEQMNIPVDVMAKSQQTGDVLALKQHQMPYWQQENTQPILQRTTTSTEKGSISDPLHLSIKEQALPIEATNKDKDNFLEEPIEVHPQSIVRQITMKNKAETETNEDCANILEDWKIKSIKPAEYQHDIGDTIMHGNSSSSEMKHSNGTKEMPGHMRQDLKHQSLTSTQMKHTFSTTDIFRNTDQSSNRGSPMKHQFESSPNLTCIYDDNKKGLKSPSVEGIDDENLWSHYDSQHFAESTFQLNKEKTVACSPNTEQDIPTPVLQGIASQVGSEWKKLLRYLGLREQEIENIDHKHDDLEEKAYQGLLKWIQAKGSIATAENLRKALLLAGRRDLAETFYKQQASQEYASGSLQMLPKECGTEMTHQGSQTNATTLSKSKHNKNIIRNPFKALKRKFKKSKH